MSPNHSVWVATATKTSQHPSTATTYHLAAAPVYCNCGQLPLSPLFRIKSSAEDLLPSNQHNEIGHKSVITINGSFYGGTRIRNAVAEEVAINRNKTTICL